MTCIQMTILAQQCLWRQLFHASLALTGLQSECRTSHSSARRRSLPSATEPRNLRSSTASSLRPPAILRRSIWRGSRPPGPRVVWATCKFQSWQTQPRLSFHCYALGCAKSVLLAYMPCKPTKTPFAAGRPRENYESFPDPWRHRYVILSAICARHCLLNLQPWSEDASCSPSLCSI